MLQRTEKSETDIRYMLISPYATAHIYWDNKEKEMIYDLEEPVLNEEEKQNFEKIEKAMLDMVNINMILERDEKSLIEYIDRTLKLIISELGLKIAERTYEKLFYYIYRNFIGLNEIEALMHDYYIEDIECNGVDQQIYVIHRIFRNLRTNIKFTDIDALANFVEKLAQKTGRYISYASPLLDGTLPDGSRVNATYTTDITSKGPTFTIRKFTKIPWTPIQLLSFNSLSPEMLAYFWILLQYKSNILITGGTASGKTTLLNAIAFFIPPESRVVSIEDTRELNLPRQNWLPSVARTGLAGGVGEINMFSLLKNSFRQNPDYVIVGEVRGKEAYVLFQGMASGHASISTMHADSVDSVIRRLETPPISLNPTLVNTLDAIAIMTHAIVKNRETRKLREIVEVVDVDRQGIAMTNTPFVWNPGDDKFYFKRDSKVFEKIERKNGIPKQELEKEFELRIKLLYELFRRKILGFDEIENIVNEYYKNPAAVLQRFGIK